MIYRRKQQGECEKLAPKGLAEESKMLGANEQKSGIPRTRIIEGCGQQGSCGPPVGKNQDEGRGHPSQENGCGLFPRIVKKNGDGTNRIDPEDLTETSNGVQGSAETSNGEKRIPRTRIIEVCGQQGICGPPVGKNGCGSLPRDCQEKRGWN